MKNHKSKNKSLRKYVISLICCMFCLSLCVSCDSEAEKLSMKQSSVKEEYEKMKNKEEEEEEKNQQNEENQQVEEVKEEKSEFELVDNEDDDSFMKIFSRAKHSVIVVDNEIPEWLLSRIDALIEDNPYLRIYLIQSKKKIRHRNIFFIPDLKASFVVVDAACVLFNPTYSVSDLGLSYYVCNDVIGDKYFQFAQNIARDHTVD